MWQNRRGRNNWLLWGWEMCQHHLMCLFQTVEVDDLVSMSPPASTRHRRNVSDTSALRLPNPNRSSAFRCGVAPAQWDWKSRFRPKVFAPSSLSLTVCLSLAFFFLRSGYHWNQKLYLCRVSGFTGATRGICCLRRAIWPSVNRPLPPRPAPRPGQSSQTPGWTARVCHLRSFRSGARLIVNRSPYQNPKRRTEVNSLCLTLQRTSPVGGHVGVEPVWWRQFRAADWGYDFWAGVRQTPTWLQQQWVGRLMTRTRFFSKEIDIFPCRENVSTDWPPFLYRSKDERLTTSQMRPRLLVRIRVMFAFFLLAGISNVKSREDLVMSNTDLSTVNSDPFGAAPFPKASNSEFLSFADSFISRLVVFHVLWTRVLYTSGQTWMCVGCSLCAAFKSTFPEAAEHRVSGAANQKTANKGSRRAAADSGGSGKGIRWFSFTRRWRWRGHHTKLWQICRFGCSESGGMEWVAHYKTFETKLNFLYDVPFCNRQENVEPHAATTLHPKQQLWLNDKTVCDQLVLTSVSKRSVSAKCLQLYQIRLRSCWCICDHSCVVSWKWCKSNQWSRLCCGDSRVSCSNGFMQERRCLEVSNRFTCDLFFWAMLSLRFFAENVEGILWRYEYLEKSWCSNVCTPENRFLCGANFVCWCLFVMVTQCFLVDLLKEM